MDTHCARLLFVKLGQKRIIIVLIVQRILVSVIILDPINLGAVGGPRDSWRHGNVVCSGCGRLASETPWNLLFGMDDFGAECRICKVRILIPVSERNLF